MAMSFWRGRALAGAMAGAMALTGCATAPNPQAPVTTAARSAGEQQAGDQAYPQILRRFGGPYRDRALQAYIDKVGRRIVASTEQSDEKWTFTLLDSPVVNAFATPGGYVYVTRGLVALAGDEAQLAGVIGHEIGHVTAAHAVGRNQRAATAQIGVIAAVIGAQALGLGGAAAEAIGQIGGAVAQGSIASYSRQQELEADALGVRYLAAAGYDPRAEGAFLRRMRAQAELSAKLEGRGYNAGRVDFFSTHPANAQRVQMADRAAAQFGVRDAPDGQARFLSAIGGMRFGDEKDGGRIRIVTIRPGDTVERLAARSALRRAAAETLRVLNGLDAGEQPRAGTRFKTVR